MRICFFCNSIFSYGGVQKVLAVVAKEMSKENDITILTMDDESKIDKSIYCLDQYPNISYRFIRFYDDSNSIEYYLRKFYSLLYKKVFPRNILTSELYSKSSFPKFMRQRLINELQDGKYDVIIGVHAFLSIKLATIRKNLSAKIVIGWMHNSYQAFFENEPTYLPYLKNHFIHQMKKLDKLVVLTESDADLYRKKLGLNPSVIYNPVTISTTLSCNPIAKKFLSIGRMSYRHKGFDVLIKAFAIFAQTNKEWTLEIVGEGKEREKLISLIKKNNLERRITIFPFTKDIHKHYSSSSIFILSSRWEGMPLVIAEAMSFGLPIISSDIPVSKEILYDNSFCFLFKNEDEEDLARNMQNAINCDIEGLSPVIKEYASQFSIESCINRWNKLLSIK